METHKHAWSRQVDDDAEDSYPDYSVTVFWGCWKCGAQASYTHTFRPPDNYSDAHATGTWTFLGGVSGPHTNPQADLDAKTMVMAYCRDPECFCGGVGRKG